MSKGEEKIYTILRRECRARPRDCKNLTKEKIDLTIKHFKYLLEIKPEKQAVLEMRTHAAWYIKGLNKSKEVKLEIFKCETKEELLKILVEYKKIL